MPHEYRIIVSGIVQGVFFRAKTKEHADLLGIKGTVRNLVSGEVEIRVAATKEKTDQLIAAMEAEPPPIQIDAVKIYELSSEKAYTSFKIVD